MPWAGRLSVEPGRALYLGPADDTSPHAHWAIQVAVGIDGPVRIDVAGAPHRHAGVVVASGVPHVLHGARALALVYLEPLSELGQAAAVFVGGRPLAVLPAATVDALRALVAQQRARRPDDTAGVLANAFGATREPVSRPQLERARQIEAAVVRRLDGRGRLGDIAGDVGLSPSRVAALVRRGTGMPLRPLVRWCRLRIAIAAVARGATLTQAAHRRMAGAWRARPRRRLNERLARAQPPSRPGAASARTGSGGRVSTSFGKSATM